MPSSKTTDTPVGTQQQIEKQLSEFQRQLEPIRARIAELQAALAPPQTPSPEQLSIYFELKDEREAELERLEDRLQLLAAAIDSKQTELAALQAEQQAEAEQQALQEWRERSAERATKVQALLDEAASLLDEQGDHTRQIASAHLKLHGRSVRPSFISMHEARLPRARFENDQFVVNDRGAQIWL